MSDSLRKRAAKEFVEYWEKSTATEKQADQKFWNMLLRKVYGIEEPEPFIDYQKDVKLARKRTGWIDGYIPSTQVLIEHKSKNVKLFYPELNQEEFGNKPLTPAEQAFRYAEALVHNNLPTRYIITCNFKEFHIYDNYSQDAYSKPEIIKLEDLPKEYTRMQFLVDSKAICPSKELQMSTNASESIGRIYRALYSCYDDIESNMEYQRSLNVLCVRLVFLMFAEDSGIIAKDQFSDFLRKRDAEDLQQDLSLLFLVLDTDDGRVNKDERPSYLKNEFKNFPYVNGGLFDDKKNPIFIPAISEDIKNLIVDEAARFDWTDISPTIFGAMFEATLNPVTRQEGGMIYTPVENIHKVIDPLFLNDLEAEFDAIKAMKNGTKAEKKAILDALDKFKDKISKLNFLDPACGSGNFLTESYISLRRLENNVIRLELYYLGRGGDTILTPSYWIKVSIQQFYGIEINDFAVSVAKTALWIAEYQMLKETELALGKESDNFLPLETYSNIHEDNALNMKNGHDWNYVLSSDDCSYIMGNPPFVGEYKKTPEQTKEMAMVFGKGSPETKLDYVICWYKKAQEYVKDLPIDISFVSTSSICQGESVRTFWKHMFESGIEIQYAYTDFEWSNDAVEQAAVYCVIVGFTFYHKDKTKVIYSEGDHQEVKFINAYLKDTDNVWVENRKNISPLGHPKMIKGSEPSDARRQLFFSVEEKDKLLSKYPFLENYFRPFIGCKEYVSSVQNEFVFYCLWCDGLDSAPLSRVREFNQRFDKITNARKNSTADRIKNMAKYPYLFVQNRQPKSSYLIVPQHQTTSRSYIPFGFFDSDVIVGNSCYSIEGAGLYEMSIMSSRIHHAWIRTICGRLGTAVRYSPAIYNSFPWIDTDETLRNKAESSAQAIIDARNNHPQSSLEQLYSERTMPVDLRVAHERNDKIVAEIYGCSLSMTDEDIFETLNHLKREMDNNE